jgi:hypothetical protein
MINVDEAQSHSDVRSWLAALGGLTTDPWHLDDSQCGSLPEPPRRGR